MTSKTRSSVIAVSLGAGLLLGLAFRYQVTTLRREERCRVWLAYVRGPLKLYVRGSRQGVEILKKGRLTATRRQELGDAVQDLHESWTEAVAQQPSFQADGFFHELDVAVSWHGAFSRLADDWPRLAPSNRGERTNARLAAEGIHRNLAIEVSQQWEWARTLPWSPEQRKESQDAVRELLEPLPY